MRTHPIKVIVERLLATKWVPKNLSLPFSPEDDPVPEARPQEDCIVSNEQGLTMSRSQLLQECYRWDYVE